MWLEKEAADGTCDDNLVLSSDRSGSEWWQSSYRVQVETLTAFHSW